MFDKTGTLTEGKPQVVEILTFNQVSEQQAIGWAAALEQGSNHRWRAPSWNAPPDKRCRRSRSSAPCAAPASAGRSTACRCCWQRRAAGAASGCDRRTGSADARPAERGVTPVLLAVNGKPAALFAIRDPLREDSVAALQRLHRQGYQLVMLTGDNPVTANAIAKEAGIDRVIAGVLPDGKAAAIKQLQAQGQRVAMVGDGINDAPALAQADVGIAMGGGSDIAIETAAITLMRHSLHGVADAVALSKATLRNMKQNLFGAFIYNTLGIPIAAGVLYPLTGTLLSPVVAGAAMALSSITVVSNANRLLRFKPSDRRGADMAPRCFPGFPARRIAFSMNDDFPRLSC